MLRGPKNAKNDDKSEVSDSDDPKIGVVSILVRSGAALL